MITEGKLRHPKYLFYSYETLIWFSPYKEHILPDLKMKYFLLFLTDFLTEYHFEFIYFSGVINYV